MVRVKHDGIRGLLKEASIKSLICFGAGRHFNTVMELYAPWKLEHYVEFIIDNNIKLADSKKVYKDKEFEVKPIGVLQEYTNKEIVILITCHLASMDIVEQLDSINELDGTSVYIGSFLSDELNKKFEYLMPDAGQIKIPKVIHYCWFGNTDIPQEYRNFISTWKIHCPDYQVKRWDESNFDISQNEYMREAYKKKRWAFVSDYARIKILYDHGGIYLDCDVELCKSLDDFLTADFFCGFEDQNHINLGLGFGAVAGHRYLKELLDIYDKLKFVDRDGNLNETPCIAYQTTAAGRLGVKAENTYQKIDGMYVYPTEIFSPISPWGMGNKTSNSYSVHHYTASWQKNENKKGIQNVYQRYYQRIKE